jgi:hypothetical protein
MNRISATTALAALALAAACTDGTTAPTKTAIAPSFDHVSGDASAGTAVYNNIPRQIPPNVASQGYQCCQTAEFGDRVQLGGTARRARSVTVLMSDWAKHSDYPSLPDAGYTHPITLNLYAVNAGPALGALLGTVTQDFLIPWRPETTLSCVGNDGWMAGGICYHGFAFTITFDLSSLALTLPRDLIVGVAFNTQSWGYAPTGASGPYNSLNFGLADVPPGTPWVGTEDPDEVFWNNTPGSSHAGFLRHMGWTDPSPAFSISAFTVAPTDDECKKDGWRSLARTDGSLFKNQGDCVSDAHDRDPIKVGPIAVDAQEDIGTCNNVWALDSFDKFYTITSNKDGTYNVQVNYKKGTFVTLAGKSPGACESGADNDNIVDAGVTGKTHQEYNGTVTGTLSSKSCTPETCFDTTSILNTVFNTGWTWTILSDGGHWTWTGHYEAGSNGTWFDTSVNWPLNDRGDITGS